MIYDNKVIDKIINADKLVIYGAGLMGQTLRKCLSMKPYYKRVDAFIVNDLQGNPDNIEGIPVVDIWNAKDLVDEMVLVALHEKHIKEAMKELECVGFSNLIPISFDSDLWSDLRGNWMIETNIGYEDRYYQLQPKGNRFKIYVVHSDADKKLLEHIQDKCFEQSIQVGADLSLNVICDVRDNTGDNISKKNKEYCELTALYWIWKNDNSDYVGLSHYRRKFDLTEYEAGQLSASDIDVLVTVPMINLRTVREQYAADHNINDWDIMLDAIKKLYPEYYKTANQIQNGYYYYPYNMLIARKNIFDDYCEWLFNILDYCESKIKVVVDNYQRRYAGFLAERLMTIYFVHNKQYKMAIVRKHFVESD